MICHQDNFISDTLFTNLNKQMLQRFNPTLSFKKGDLRQYNDAATRLFVSAKDDGYKEAKILLGDMVPDIILKIKDFLLEKAGCVNPVANNVWFQYQTDKQKIGKHKDNGYLSNRRPHQCFSSFLYAHDVWNDDWGGEICFNTQELLPKSNRLVVYSRDEEHWVNNIKHNDPDYLRMFLGVDWSTDNDFQ